MTGSSRMTAEQGVVIVKTIVQKELGWYLRRQEEPDIGIDGHVEIVQKGRETGRILAVQIKAGPSYLRERRGSAIVARGPRDRLEYWMRYTLPVLYVIVDIENAIAYWEVVSPSTVELTPRRWRMLVHKRLDGDSSEALSQLGYSGIAPFLPRVSGHELVEETRRFALAEFAEEIASQDVEALVAQVTAEGADLGPDRAATTVAALASSADGMMVETWILVLSVAHVASKRQLATTLRVLLDVVDHFPRPVGAEAVPLRRLQHNLTAELARYTGDYPVAIKEFQRAIELSRSMGPTRQLAIDLNDFGRVLRVVDRVHDSIEVLTEALDVARSLYPWVHPDVAVIADNLASSYREAGNATDAVLRHIESLTIDLELFGSRHPYVGIDRNDFAVTLMGVGALDLARWNLEEAREIFILHFGTHHPFVASVENTRAELALLDRRWDDAEAGFRAARSIREQVGAAPDLMALDNEGIARARAGRQETGPASRKTGKS